MRLASAGLLAFVAACGGSGGETASSASSTQTASSREFERGDDSSGRSSGGHGRDDRVAVPAATATVPVTSGMAAAGAATPVPTLYSKGAITALGTIGINGARYDDRVASVTINGVPAKTDDLRLGMVAEIEGRREESTLAHSASAIRADSAVEGVIEGINPILGHLSVMGSLILVSPSTIYEGVSGLADPTLRGGDYVEVHGISSANGVVNATRVERKAARPDSRVTGTVSNLNMTNKTFQLHGRTVDYNLARLESLAAPLANGAVVRVTGGVGATGMIANEVKGADYQLATMEGFRIEQEGYVTDLAPGPRFKVNGMAVDASKAIVEGLVEANAPVEVEGILRGGVLVASKVERKQAAGTSGHNDLDQIVGTVTAADAAKFQVYGITVYWNSDTRIDDMAREIKPGMRLEVRGGWVGNQYVASRIRPDD
jgi:hypothetical protein